MLPFWKLVGLSLYLGLFYSVTGGFPSDTEESPQTCLYVALPIFQCLLIVFHAKSIQPSFKAYRLNIAQGLFLSLCGDVALVYQDHLARLAGGFLFSVAHVYYLRALGFKPFGGPATFASFVVTAGSILLFLLPGLKGLDGVLAVAYIFLLITVTWRMTVRFQLAPCLVNFLGCLGAFCFVASDYVLLRHWLITDWEHSRLVAMCLYYAAQLGISLTATDDFTPTGFESTSR